MAIDIDSREPIIGNNQGGLSGPAIKPIALLKHTRFLKFAVNITFLLLAKAGSAQQKMQLNFWLRVLPASVWVLRFFTTL